MCALYIVNFKFSGKDKDRIPTVSNFKILEINFILLLIRFYLGLILKRKRIKEKKKFKQYVLNLIRALKIIKN